MSEEEVIIQEQFEEVLNTGNDKAISEFLNKQNISDVAELVEENEEREIEIFLHFPFTVPPVFLKSWNIPIKKE